MKKCMTVREVARELGTSEQTIRIGLQQKAFPFGSAVRTSSKFTHIIPREKFEKWRNDNENC